MCVRSDQCGWSPLVWGHVERPAETDSSRGSSPDAPALHSLSSTPADDARLGHPSVRTVSLSTHTRTHTHARTHRDTHRDRHTHTQRQTNTHTHTHTHRDTHTHSQTHIDTHAHTHTHKNNHQQQYCTTDLFTFLRINRLNKY